MNVKFKGKIWKVICPKNLLFPPGIIRNALIQRDKKRVITNRNQIQILKDNFSSIKKYL